MNGMAMGIGAAAGMLVLILDSRTALAAAVEGLEMCIKTVIPSLFPFIMLSGMLMGAFSGVRMPLLRPLGKLISLPEGSESILIPAFLGGYPVGAQCIGNAYADGTVNKENAEKMLAWCSNAGPSFLFGMVGSMFPERWIAWALWGIQIGSALLTARCFPCQGSVRTVATDKKGASMGSAVAVMGCICGWVVIFRVVIGFLQRWALWLLPAEAQVAVMGILELSNGCCALADIESIGLRFAVCSGLLSFGGICVGMQTASVTEGLSLKYYWAGKGLQALFSTCLSILIWRKKWGMLLAGAMFFLIIPRKLRKNSSNPQPIGV